MSDTLAQPVAQVVLEIQLKRSPDSIETELNQMAEKGYCFGGMTRLLDRAGGGIYMVKAKGVYTFRAMLWLNPSETPSRFHVHRVQQGRTRVDLPEELSRITSMENEKDYMLREALPLDGFVSVDGYDHPGTAGFLLIFERVPA